MSESDTLFNRIGDILADEGVSSEAVADLVAEVEGSLADARDLADRARAVALDWKTSPAAASIAREAGCAGLPG